MLSFYFVLISSFLIAQAVIITPTKRVEERNGKQYFIHIVEKGQTVYSIARAYDVGIDEIYFENPSSKNGILINQELLIPTKNKETEIRQEIKQSEFEFFYHVCAEGETFKDVAEIYLLPSNKVVAANPSVYEPFREGQYLKIPVEIPESVIKAEFPPEAVKTKQTADRNFNRKMNSVSFDPNIEVIPDYRHVVIAGETAQSIADKYNVELVKLKAANPGLTDRVEVGERLRVPATASFRSSKNMVTVNKAKKVQDSNKEVEQKTINPKPVAEKPVEEPQKKVSSKNDFIIHKVRKKETLYRISRDYGVSLQELYDANPGLTEKLRIGQQIKVPKKKISKNYILHDVRSKTKLRKIAKIYGISESQIRKINPRIGKFAYRGQEVKIPVGRKAIAFSESPVEEPEKKPKEIIVEDVKEPLPCSGNQLNNSETIKIALMVPLFLEQLSDSVQVDRVMRGNAESFQPFAFINFVEGTKLAVDSLRKTGYNIELKIYDVDKSLKKTTAVLQNPEIKNMDLIIGPFYSQSFHQVALFASNFNIPIVNPLTFRSSVITDYKSVLKVKPDESTQLALIKNLVQNNYSKSKLFLITQNSYRDADKVVKLENSLRELDRKKIKFSNLDLYNYSITVAQRDEDWAETDYIPPLSMEGRLLDPENLKANSLDSTSFDNSLVRINMMSDGFDKFMNQASAFRPNTVIIYGTDKAFVMNAMNRLNEFRDSLNINVIGLPLWERFNNIDLIHANNLKTIVAQSEFIDYDSQAVQDFILKFRTNFSTDPGEYGFAGYDISMFFISAIIENGRDFTECLPYYRNKGLSRNMVFGNLTENGNSMVNLNWYLVQYYNFKKFNLLKDIE